MCFGRGSSHALVRLIPLYGHVPTCRNGRNVALYLPYSLQTEFKCRSAGDCCLLSVCDTPYQHIAYHDTWISVVHHILPATGYASRSNFKRNRLSTISSDNSLSKFLIYIYICIFLRFWFLCSLICETTGAKTFKTLFIAQLHFIIQMLILC